MRQGGQSGTQDEEDDQRQALHGRIVTPMQARASATAAAALLRRKGEERVHTVKASPPPEDREA